MKTLLILLLTCVPSYGKNAGLTAAVGAPGVVLAVKDLSSNPLYMVLLNQGRATAYPEKLATRLLLNGQPVKGEAVAALLKGPQVPEWKELGGGKHVQFGVSLDALIAKPGLYRLQWEGDGFSSNEARILVVP